MRGACWRQGEPLGSSSRSGLLTWREIKPVNVSERWRKNLSATQELPCRVEPGTVSHWQETRRMMRWWTGYEGFFFFIMSSVEGFVLWEHTLWCCLQERPPFGLQVDELDQLLVRTVGTLTLDWQSFIPGRIHRASHKKIKHDALLLDIYWCPVGLRQMTISIINESISWVYEMLKKGGNSLSQLPGSESVTLKLPFLSRIPKVFIWLQMTEKINRLTNILKIQLLQLLYS